MHQKILHSAVATAISLAGLAAVFAAVAHTVFAESRPSLSPVQNDFAPSSITASKTPPELEVPSAPLAAAPARSSAEVFSTLPVAAKGAKTAHNLAADGSLLAPVSN